MGALICVAAILGVPAGYAVACWRFPFAACLRCKGSGVKRSASGKSFRMCRRCGGSSRRLRVGRVVWNYLHR